MLQLLSLVAASLAWGGDLSSQSVGTSGADFLNIDVGPRAVAMGGAYTAVSNDAYALYWNPAGLAHIPRTTVALMHNRYVADITLDYGAYAQRIDDMSVGAAAFRILDVGSIGATDINGASAGSIRPKAYVWELGYGQYVLDLSDSERDVTIGLAGRYAHSDLVRHADIFTGDFGMQSDNFGARFPWRFGAVLQNVGRGPKYEQVRDTPPLRGKLGAAIQPAKYWLFTLDGVLPSGNRPYLAAGGEATLEAHRDAQAFLRAGVDLNPIMSGLDQFRGLTLGFGVKTLQFGFDYSFSPLGNLGTVHRFAVSFNLPTLGPRRYRER
ncbi:MAG: PorV/PorQ family protein [Elusimicrobia bacterium]|nr:PorV/PorQ family protein [Elusimicrobiota bacterium]